MWYTVRYKPERTFNFYRSLVLMDIEVWKHRSTQHSALAPGVPSVVISQTKQESLYHQPTSVTPDTAEADTIIKHHFSNKENYSKNGTNTD